MNAWLVYCGPLAQTGIIGPATGRRYVATQGQPFEVHGDDMVDLLRQYPGLLVQPEEPKRHARRAEVSDQE